jgi:hypothetical protein
VTPAEFFKVQPLEDYEWPVTYRFLTRCSWGDTQLELTIDAPEAQADVPTTLELGRTLWNMAVAPATSSDVTLVGWDTVAWRFIAAGLPSPDGISRGLLPGPVAPRENCAAVVLKTAHADDLSRRIVVHGGTPAAWSSGRLLTLGARDALETWSCMLLMGLGRDLTGSPIQWLIHYNDLLPASSSNPSGVAFRKVNNVRGLYHVERAPDPSTRPWP